VQRIVMTNPVAFVLLENAGLPEKKVLMETLRRRHPGLDWEISTAAADAEADDLLLIRVGDHLAGVLLMRAPTPINQSAWQLASSGWPEALQALGKHRAHLVV
jgi:hypothetical protein